MSLFGSIYEESGDGPTAPEPDAAGDPTPAPSPFAFHGDEPAPAEGVEAPGAVPIQMPDGPSMSLQDFAAEVFGTKGEAEQALAVEEPVLESLDTAVVTLPGEASGVPAAADVPAPAALLETGILPAGSDGATADPSPPSETFSLVDDDLLPAMKPARSMSLPSLPNAGAKQIKLALVVLVALVAGFVGYRMFAGGGSGSSDAAADAPAAEAPGRPSGGFAGAIDTAELTAAEAELTQAAVAAQAHFAEASSFAMTPEQWDQLVPAQVVAGEGPPAEGVIQVVSDQDAACFQTATRSGTTAAVGITGQGVTFASDSSGATLCTVDAAALAGWASTLSPLSP